MSVGLTRRTRQAATDNVSDTTSDSNSPVASNASSSEDLKKLELSGSASKGKSITDRAKIPLSFYLIIALIVSFQYAGGLFSMKTLKLWYSSMTTSAQTTWNLLVYSVSVAKTLVDGEYLPWAEYARTGLIFFIAASLFYVFFVAPFRAGLWTGSRALRHKLHRFAGLAYLIQYSFAWIEFFTNYDQVAAGSVMTHAIAVNGILQGMSAFFSFKVLPELADPGYYSDKAVLSRTFVHENLFFTLMSVFGSIYYIPDVRASIKAHPLGRIVEFVYVFWPYILVRPFFPVTKFSSAGTTHKGRSEKNQRFYEIGTLMVKIFYLWAKYFLGFFVNYSIYLGLPTADNWRMLHGMLLLNAGTVSLAVFLHTLRFRKVLPAKFTFSVYLGQIYLTFAAIPVAFDLFTSHKMLCGVCFTGILLNMTRSRKLHAVWCGIVMYLLHHPDLEW